MRGRVVVRTAQAALVGVATDEMLDHRSRLGLCESSHGPSPFKDGMQWQCLPCWTSRKRTAATP